MDSWYPAVRVPQPRSVLETPTLLTGRSTSGGASKIINTSGASLSQVRDGPPARRHPRPGSTAPSALDASSRHAAALSCVFSLRSAEGSHTSGARGAWCPAGRVSGGRGRRHPLILLWPVPAGWRQSRPQVVRTDLGAPRKLRSGGGCVQGDVLPGLQMCPIILQ